MAPRSPTPLVLSAALALVACNDLTVLAPPTAPSDLRIGVIGAPTPARYLVGFDGAASIAPDVLVASGGLVVDSIPAFNVLVLDGVTNPDALRNAQPTYIEAEFEVTTQPVATDDAPVFAEAVVGQANTPWYTSGVQWDIKAMHADEGWALTNGGDGMKVCIVDTGVDDQHQELNNGKVLARANFVTFPSTETSPTLVSDPNGHGSHVAGEATGRGVVVSGVAPRASLLSARVLNSAASGSETAIVNGIRWCADQGAHTVNVSLGAARYKGTPFYISSPITYGNAIKYANDLGAVVIVSAGNSNLQLPNPMQITVPAQVPGTIIVGATGPLTKSTAPAPPAWNAFDPAQVWHGPDARAHYSNYGNAVHVFAPGGRGGIPLSEVLRFVNGVPQGTINDQIWGVCSGQSGQFGNVDAGGVPGASGSCTNATNRYVAFAGTSMAAPHVTGLATLLYAELGGVRTPENRARIENCIKTTTDNIGPEEIFGKGRVNVRKAIDAIRAGAC